MDNMTLVRTLFISLFLTFIFQPAADAQQFRPFCGSGVVIIRPFNPESTVAPASIPFYRDPGVARIVERPAPGIPSLSSILKMPAGEYPLAVMGKKGNWLRIAYDDAGREGWVEKARWWDYITWEDFLKGRVARLLPGLKKGSYALRAESSPTAPQTGALSGKEDLRIIEVKDDWALVIAGSGLSGWLAWQDGDGRFLINISQ
jgi:SH3-like domain-containing protein